MLLRGVENGRHNEVDGLQGRRKAEFDYMRSSKSKDIAVVRGTIDRIRTNSASGKRSASFSM